MLSGGSHPFQDRLEVRRSEVLGLLYLAIQYVDIGIPLGHIRRMDLIEDRFEIDSVGVAYPVDNVQEVREGIGNLHQIPSFAALSNSPSSSRINLILMSLILSSTRPGEERMKTPNLLWNSLTIRCCEFTCTSPANLFFPVNREHFPAQNPPVSLSIASTMQ